MVETKFHKTDDGQKLAFSQVNGDKKYKKFARCCIFEWFEVG